MKDDLCTELAGYLVDDYHYNPQEAIDAGIEGRVFVGFVVEKDGSVSSIKLLRGIGYGCDEAAMDVVRKMPKWKPGMQGGKPIRVSWMFPVKFELGNK